MQVGLRTKQAGQGDLVRARVRVRVRVKVRVRVRVWVRVRVRWRAARTCTRGP